MSVDQLDIQIDDLNTVELRHHNNSSYLKGFTDSPILANKSRTWLYVGYGMAIISSIALAIYIVLMFLIWLFHSPFAVEIEGIIDGRRGFNIEYHYEVDSVRYDKVEPSTRTVSSWADGNVPEPIVYLSFMPSQSRLTFNREPFDAFLAIVVTIILIVLIIGGVLQVRVYRKANQLANEATHIVKGVVTQTILGQKRLKNVYYKATSPATGEDITGTTSIGALEPTYKQIEEGTHLAILYANDDLHGVL